MKKTGLAVACGAALLSVVVPMTTAGLVAGAATPQAGAASRSAAADPIITGPVAATSALRDPAHGYPFSATPMDLARQGYVEEDFFIQGMASRYSTPPMATGGVIDTNHPYKTRVLVRRPRTAARFNGTAIVEWTNVSQGHDNEVDWFQSGAHLVAAGYAWVGVSAQRVGVDALKQWSPSRYGTLDVSAGSAITNDALAYDIFTAAGRAIRGQPRPGVMGGLRVDRLIATGHSQSAGRLYAYFTSVHPLAPVFDGVVLHGGGGQLRSDLNVKVWKLLSETDVTGQTRQPDSDALRTWEVAGSSHLDAQLSRGLGSIGLLAAGGTPVDGMPPGPTVSGGGAGTGNFQTPSSQPRDGCAKPIFSRIPSHYVQNALYDHFAQWIRTGTPPPTAPPIEIKEASAGAPPVDPGVRRGARGGPTTLRVVARDDAGNVLGGIRLSQHAVPTATNTGQNNGGMFCGLLGSFEPFDAARLAALYPTHDSYLEKVRAATESNLKSGYLVRRDADATIAEARSSTIGKR